MKSKMQFKIYQLKQKISLKKDKTLENAHLSLNGTARYYKTFGSLMINTIYRTIIIALIVIAINWLGKFFYTGSIVDLVSVMTSKKNNEFHFNDAYYQFLLTSLGFSGFLYALFFSNVTSIFSLNYKNIPYDTSKYLIYGYENRKAIEVMKNYLINLIVQIFMHIEEIEITILLSIATVIYTVWLMIIYFILAERIFSFSSINSLTRTICVEIRELLKDAKRIIKKNNAKVVIEYYSEEIFKKLTHLKKIQKKIFDDKNIDDFEMFFTYCFDILVEYNDFKNIIPLDSKWFQTREVVSKWCDATEFEIQVYIRNGINLPDKEVPNYTFMEDVITEMFFETYNYLFQEKMYKQASKIGWVYANFSKRIISASGDYEYWMRFNEKIKDCSINNELINNEYLNILIDELEFFDEGIIVESLSYLDNTYKEYFENSKRLSSSELLSQDNNNKLFFKKETNDFLTKLQNEKTIEKQIITGDAFIYEFFASLYIRDTASLFDSMRTICKNYLLFANKMASNQKYAIACVAYCRLIELISKILNSVDEFKAIYNNLNSKQLNFKFEKIDFEDFIDEISSTYHNLLKEYSNCCLKCESITFSKNEVDYIGQVFHLNLQEILQLIINSDLDKFNAFYATFANTCIMYNAIMSQDIDWHKISYNHLCKVMEPTIALMEISGLAIFNARLVNEQKWELIIIQWIDDILKKPLGKKMLNMFKICFTILSDSLYWNDNNFYIKQKYENYINNNKLINIKNSENNFYMVNEIETNDKFVKEYTYLDENKHISLQGDFYKIYLYYCYNPYVDKKDKIDLGFDFKENTNE